LPSAFFALDFADFGYNGQNFGSFEVKLLYSKRQYQGEKYFFLECVKKIMAVRAAGAVTGFHPLSFNLLPSFRANGIYLFLQV